MDTSNVQQRDMYMRLLDTGASQNIIREINDALPPLQQLFHKLSNGWLQRFKHRHDFKAYKSNGETGAADVAAI